MKKIPVYIITFCILLFAGCSKNGVNNKLPGAASLTVINAQSDVSAALMKFSDSKINYAVDQAIAYYQDFYEYAAQPGNLPVTVVSADDTTHTIYQNSFSLKGRSMYSLYLFGNIHNPQSLFMEDQIPAHQDSVAGLRFVNLSEDSSPVNVVLEGGPQNEFSNLAYKQVSEFKNYPTTAAVAGAGGYTFNIVDGSGNILTSIGWNYTKFRNTTMVISGLQADGSISVFQVKNF